MHTYYAITIGPIFKTLGLARKTRELWAASYLFSYLMKKIVLALKAKNTTILLPYAEDCITIGENEVNLFEGKYGAGIFPDRCIFHTDKTLTEVDQIVSMVKSEFIAQIIKHSEAHVTQFDVDCAERYFENYFQICLVSKKLKDNLQTNEIVGHMYDALDAVELQRQIAPPENQAFLSNFLSKASFKKGKDHSFLMQASEELTENENVRFESVIEIATKDLHGEINNYKETFSFKEDEEVISKLKQGAGDAFCTYHKYIAIVHIDGDNFGLINKKLNDVQYKEFSKNLTRFSLSANTVISDYGGLPVYIGGDDAVFFAPLRNETGEIKTIFDLLDKIDAIFNHEFSGLIHDIQNLKFQDSAGNTIMPQLSLSAGISVTYHKYPLYEAVESSRHQLFGVAKKEVRASGIAKNAIAFNLEKHSGKTFSGIFFKDKTSKSFKIFKEMLSIHIEKDNFLSSIIQFVGRNESILLEIGHDTERVKEFIDNLFNETIHEENDFIEKLKELVPAVYTEYRKSVNKKTTGNRNRALMSIIRMVKFLNRKDNE